MITSGAGRARHSVRAVVVNQNAFVGRRRRAGDCPPYLCEMMATSINYEGLPPVAPKFDAAALRANILDSQRHGQPYREFTRRGPCRIGHLITGRAAVPRSPLYLGGAAATALPMAASASPTGAAPATSIRNGSPGPCRPRLIEVLLTGWMSLFGSGLR
jgi:hypothetical protein